MLQEYKIQLLRTFWESCVEDAIKALSIMIKSDVKKTRTIIKVSNLKEIPKMMNPEEITTTLVYTKVPEQIKFVIMFSSSLRGFLNLINMLLNKKIDYYTALNEDNEPVMVEFGNIINGYFVSSLDRVFGKDLNYQDAVISTNPFRAVEDFGMGNIYKEKVKVLVFRTDFSVKNENVEGKMFLLAEEKKLDVLLEEISRNIRFKA
ncbi:MAG: hypothetical protein V1818_03060 [Candidatus Aenigmatarchaeota archaeon]